MNPCVWVCVCGVVCSDPKCHLKKKKAVLNLIGQVKRLAVAVSPRRCGSSTGQLPSRSDLLGYREASDTLLSLICLFSQSLSCFVS